MSESSACEWTDEILKQFQAIAQLQPGWDSYGGLAPSIAAIGTAGVLLAELCKATSWCPPKPHVNPTPDGGIQFEWEEGQRYFEIHVMGFDTITYYYVDEAIAIEQSGIVTATIPLQHVVDYIRRVTGELSDE
jgi:hypothetical protein